MSPDPDAPWIHDPDRWADRMQPWAFCHSPAWLDVVREAVLALPDPPDAAARLVALGRIVEDRERGAWGRVSFRDDPKADAMVAAMWSRWALGQPWGDQGRWMALLRKPVVRSFRQALSARPLPPDVVRRALADLQDALFYQLLGGAGATSGLQEIAATVLEGAPGGPLAPLLRVLSDRGRGVVATCVTHRGHWPATVARGLPDLPGSAERALSLRDHLDPDRAAAWLDLHVALRLIQTWSEGGAPDPDRDRAVVVQNRGRARGRLRAVVARRAPPDLLPALLALDELADRTRAAARRWAWAWAWDALATGFAFDLGRPVIRPCETEAGPEPLDTEEIEILRVWALLVTLRGRWEQLLTWARTGEGGSDGTWGRLLGEIPVDLRDADGRLTRVRAALVKDTSLAGFLAPILKEVGTLPPGRRLKDAFWRVVDPIWHDAVGRPRSGFPTATRYAAAWVHPSEGAGGLPAAPQEFPP